MPMPMPPSLTYFLSTTPFPPEKRLILIFLVPVVMCGWCHERFDFQRAGVESVWINYTCPGDVAASSTCWTREGVAEYCVKSAFGNVGNVLLP